MNEPITEEYINSLLTYTDALMNHVYWVKQDFDLLPQKEHFGAAINYCDLSERRIDFVKNLVYTVTDWVFSKAKSDKIFNEHLVCTQGNKNISSAFLIDKARDKFRCGQPQGQFGELLLFNFIQHFFGAVPLLRKMSIATSSNLERFGADAIHFKKENDNNIFILGESKCYSSDYQFSTAIKKSLESILNTFNQIDNEIAFYSYEDFIEPNLEDIAIKYKNGTLPNTKYELVCLIGYNETTNVIGKNEREIKENIVKIIRSRCNKLNKDIYSMISEAILMRLNYIIFPFWEFDELLKYFQKVLGI
jgi:hypothetical protein